MAHVHAYEVDRQISQDQYQWLPIQALHRLRIDWNEFRREKNTTAAENGITKVAKA